MSGCFSWLSTAVQPERGGVSRSSLHDDGTMPMCEDGYTPNSVTVFKGSGLPDRGDHGKKTVRITSLLSGRPGQRGGGGGTDSSADADIPGFVGGIANKATARLKAQLAAAGGAVHIDALTSLGFAVHRAASIHSSVVTSTSKPVAILGLECVTGRGGDLEFGSDSSAEARSSGTASTSGPAQPSDSAFSMERSRNKLFPLFINGVAKQYFKISTIRDYAQVLRKLLRRDPLLTFALQKAIKHLRIGECKTVSHVTSDPTATSASLYGLRITPCVWADTDNVMMAALLLEHNVPYNPEDVMPRLLRDYAVLSHVPSMLTLIDFSGQVLYQNASSLDYMGDLSSFTVSIAGLGHGGMLALLFHFEPHHLDALLQEVLAGNCWQQVVQVPPSLKRHFLQNRGGPDADGGNAAKRLLSASSHQLIISENELEPEFQIDSFTTKGARDKRGGVGNAMGRPLARGQAAMLQQFPSRAVRQLEHSQSSSLTVRNVSGVGSSLMGAGANARNQFSNSGGGVIPEDGSMSSIMGPLPTGGSLGPDMQLAARASSASFSVPPSTLSFSAAKGGGPPASRRFMSLVAAAAQPAAQGQSFTGSVHSAPSDEEQAQQGQSPPGPGGGAATTAAAAAALAQPAECWHEVSAIPLLDPVLDKQVILLVQSNVSARVELENRLADLTDAQLGMLEQLFPRHVIEYMLSSKSSGNVSRNLTSLANSHEMVMVLFTDVVGFTSMSKEVEPSQVMQFLNQLYTVFDELVDEFDLYKLDTVGDCYIVVAGLIKTDEEGFACTVESDDIQQRLFHAQMMMAFAKSLLRDSKKVLMPHNNESVALRVGIHCGPLVSGLVGPKMPKFTLFGDTMNTASRLESTCKPGCVQVSDLFSKLLPHEEWNFMGGVEMKGKGTVDTYLWTPPVEEVEDDDGDSVDLSGVPMDKSGSLHKSATLRSRPFTGSTHRSVGRRQSMAASCISDHGNSDPLAAILKNIRGSQTGSRSTSIDGASDGRESSVRYSNASSKRSSNRGAMGVSHAQTFA